MTNLLAKIWKNKKQLPYYIFCYPRKLFLRYLGFIFDDKILKLIKNLPFQTSAGLDKIFLFSSFRVSSKERYSIFDTTIKNTFKSFGQHIPDVVIADSSDEPYLSQNKLLLSKLFSNHNYRVLSEKMRLPEAYLKVMENSSKEYFCTFFDDQPIIGIDDSFLEAATGLLRDFEGLVDIILFEYPSCYSIDPESKTIKVNLSDLEFKQKGIKILDKVTYGNHSFAIMRNYHYGFFFNNMIGRVRDYSRRLRWYMDHIDFNSPHQIELAGMRRIGPIYNYIAIPCGVFMLDLDFVHTGIAIREAGKKNEKLFKALGDGYKLIIN